MDLELELFGDLKDKSGSSSVGKVYMLSLSSQPVDHEDASGERQKVSTNQQVLIQLYNQLNEYTLHVCVMITSRKGVPTTFWGHSSRW